jgi:predicted NBD/HSP70 family sugar kinase
MLPDEVVRLMRETLSNFRRKRVIDEARLAGIGIAIPDWLGDVPVIGFPEAYHAWRNFDLRDAVEKLTRQVVFIDNDANAAAAGELQFGLGRESRSFFYILANACLGGGLVLDGRQHLGAARLSGEIGWLPTTPRDPGFGGSVKLLGKVFSLFMLYDFLRENGVVVSEPKHLLTLDAKGRALVSQWLKQVSGHIAEAIIHIGLIIDPDAVLIGGRFPKRLLDELLIHVYERLEKMGGGPHPPVHRAAASEDAPALGAATMPLANMLMLRTADAA